MKEKCENLWLKVNIQRGKKIEKLCFVEHIYYESCRIVDELVIMVISKNY